MKKIRLFKIRPIILISLIILISSVIIVTLSLQYYFQKDLAFDATKDNFKHISQKLEQNINSLDDKNNSIISMFELYSMVTKIPQEKKKHPLLPLITNTIKNNTFINAIYVGHGNGDFYEVINLSIDKSIRKKYKLNDKYKWQVVKIYTKENKRIRVEEFLDTDLNLLLTLKKSAFYNPIIRPWYKQAMEAKNYIIKTAPYMFSNLEAQGITYAKRVKKDCVLGIDVSLKSLSSFLISQRIDKEHEIYLFRNEGEITASSKEKKKVNKKDLIFTQEEKEFITKSKKLKVPNEKDYPPFDFMINNEPKGFSIDLLRLIGEKSGLKFEYMQNLQWNELLQLYKNKKIDLFHTISKNMKKENLGIFTNSYKDMQIKLLTNRNSINIKTLEDMKNKKLAVIKGFDIEEFIKINYPKIKLIYVQNPKEALEKLSNQNVDAFIERDLIAQYHIKQNNIKDIILVNNIKKLSNKKSQGIHFLIQKENTMLASIIQKTLDSISKEEFEVLNKKWFSDNVKIEKIPYKKIIDLALSNGFNVKHKNIQIKNKDHFVYISKLNSTYKTKEYLAMIIPVEYIMQPYTQKIIFSFLTTLAILSFTIPLIWYLSRFFSEPIDKLAIQNEKIKRRDFLNVKKVKTNIKEIDELSNSLIDMSKSIYEYQKSQEELLNSFTQILASAIDAKSIYTGEHCKRVPILSMMIAQKAHEDDSGIFKEFSIKNDDEKRELNIAAWLHDCGKVTTPEYVIDKATKLETIYNRIHEVRTRFEVIHRDLTIKSLQNILNGHNENEEFKKLSEEHHNLQKEFELIATANIGSEFMSEADIRVINNISTRTWLRHFDDTIGISSEEKDRIPKNKNYKLPHIENLLSNKEEHIIPRKTHLKEIYKKYDFKVEIPKYQYNLGELYNLGVKKGTLTTEERFKIKEHIMMSIIMLEALPFPKNLKNIPEYAAAHHETLIGTGYPRKLKKEDMSIPARILAIADVFEALTSPDRPYKKGKTIRETIEILHKMVQNKEIDEDIFNLFLKNNLHKEYGKLFLTKEQLCDDIDVNDYL